MKISTFFVVKAIICFLFGIGFALAPVAVGAIYEITLDPDGLIMARFFASALIGIGLLLWLSRNEGRNSLKNITLSLFVCDTLGFIVSLLAQLSGLMNPLGWIIVIIWLLLALGLGYFSFLKTS